MSRYWRLAILLVPPSPAHRRRRDHSSWPDGGAPGGAWFRGRQSDSGERALELLEQFAFDIVITDLRLPGIDGARVIEAARDRYPSIVAIVITGFGTVKDAVDAIKRGASDFVAKPFQFDELLHVLQNALGRGATL